MTYNVFGGMLNLAQSISLTRVIALTTVYVALPHYTVTMVRGLNNANYVSAEGHPNM